MTTDLVTIQTRTRDTAWQPAASMTYGYTGGWLPRPVAEERIAIARRLWPGKEYRLEARKGHVMSGIDGDHEPRIR